MIHGRSLGDGTYGKDTRGTVPMQGMLRGRDAKSNMIIRQLSQTLRRLLHCRKVLACGGPVAALG